MWIPDIRCLLSKFIRDFACHVRRLRTRSSGCFAPGISLVKVIGLRVARRIPFEIAP
jgi:hypothetical protein